MYRNDGAVVFAPKIVFKFGFEKGVFLTKFQFYIKRSMEIYGKGLPHFYQETSSLIDNQTNHRTNMFSPYKSNSCYEPDYTVHLYCDQWQNIHCSFKYLSSVHV